VKFCTFAKTRYFKTKVARTGTLVPVNATYSLDMFVVLTINAVPDGTALMVAGFYGGES